MPDDITKGFKVVAPVLRAELRYVTREAELEDYGLTKKVAMEGPVIIKARQPRVWRSPLWITKDEIECLTTPARARIQMMDRKPWQDCVIYRPNRFMAANDDAEKWLYAFINRGDAVNFIMAQGPTDKELVHDSDWRIFNADLRGMVTRAYDDLCKCQCYKCEEIRIVP